MCAENLALARIQSRTVLSTGVRFLVVEILYQTVVVMAIVRPPLWDHPGIQITDIPLYKEYTEFSLGNPVKI
jgi:hypothetical protein